MGYNVSKTERDLSKRYKNRHYRNQQPITVIHHNSSKKRRSRRKQRHGNPLQNEYDAWLRALSLDHDYNRQASNEPTWQKQKGPWHASLQRKVSSLLSSRKHKRETIIWPQELVDAQVIQGKKGGQPPSVRLTFTTNQEQYDAIRKKLNKSQRAKHEVSGRKAKKRPKLPIDRRKSEFEYMERPSNASLLAASFHSSTSDARSIEKDHRKQKQRSNVSLNTSTSPTSSGHSFKYSSVEKTLRKRKNKGSRRRESKVHDGNMWSVPDEYNAIQVGEWLVTPQILPSDSPSTSSFQPSASYRKKKPPQKYFSSNYDPEFESFYAYADGFQLAGDEDIGIYGRSPAISPAFQFSESDPKLDRIMTEVGEDFKKRFSVTSSLVESLPDLNGSLKPKKSRNNGKKRSQRRMSHDVLAKTSKDLAPVNTSFTSSTMERSFGKKKSFDNDNYKENWRLIDFPPHQSDNFILTRTNELCAKTLNEELNKLGYKDVIAELNDSPLYIKHSSPTSPQSESPLPGEVLRPWTKDKLLSKFRSSSKENYSSHKSVDHQEKGQRAGLYPAAASAKVGSVDDLSSVQDDPTFIDEVMLESKISDMVKLMLADKLGVQRRLENPRKKNHPHKNYSQTAISTDDVENIIESQLAAIVTKLIIPPK